MAVSKVLQSFAAGLQSCLGKVTTASYTPLPQASHCRTEHQHHRAPPAQWYPSRSLAAEHKAWILLPSISMCLLKWCLAYLEFWISLEKQDKQRHAHICARIVSHTPVHTSFIVYDKSDKTESPAPRPTLHMIVKMTWFLVILTMILLYMEIWA